MDSPGSTGEVMKKSKFSESQTVAVLKEGEAGVPTLRTPSVMLKRPMEFENASGGSSSALR
jgi:hypothetical protein